MCLYVLQRLVAHCEKRVGADAGPENHRLPPLSLPHFGAYPPWVKWQVGIWLPPIFKLSECILASYEIGDSLGMYIYLWPQRGKSQLEDPSESQLCPSALTLWVVTNVGPFFQWLVSDQTFITMLIVGHWVNLYFYFYFILSFKKSLVALGIELRTWLILSQVL